MNIPSNEYMKKVKKLARDGKIRLGERQTLFVVHEGQCPCMRDPARHECICRPEIRGIDQDRESGCLLHIYMYANERRESTNPIVMARYNFLFFSSLVFHDLMLYVQPTINNMIININFIFQSVFCFIVFFCDFPAFQYLNKLGPMTPTSFFAIKKAGDDAPAFQEVKIY